MIGKDIDANAIASYAHQFTRLSVNRTASGPSPHKACMLLAVLDLARAGGLPENRISFAPPLLDRYRLFFDAVRRPADHANPYFPFFHLKGALRGGRRSFWHLAPLPGRESALDALDSARSLRSVTDNVAYAYLDDELFALLQDPASIDRLSAVLSGHWFGRQTADLDSVARMGREIGAYEQRLRETDTATGVIREAPEAIRSPAFRRVVTQIYDYRCAASGTRVILADGTVMVEAAHIHPFAESSDDDPRNGLALTPNMHWAMDQNLIAPGPDYRWHVSKNLDERIADHGFLVSLRGRPLILPGERRWYPRQDVLEWKHARIAR